MDHVISGIEDCQIYVTHDNQMHEIPVNECRTLHSLNKVVAGRFLLQDALFVLSLPIDDATYSRMTDFGGLWKFRVDVIHLDRTQGTQEGTDAMGPANAVTAPRHPLESGDPVNAHDRANESDKPPSTKRQLTKESKKKIAAAYVTYEWAGLLVSKTDAEHPVDWLDVPERLRNLLEDEVNQLEDGSLSSGFKHVKPKGPSKMHQTEFTKHNQDGATVNATVGSWVNPKVAALMVVAGKLDDRLCDGQSVHSWLAWIKQDESNLDAWLASNAERWRSQECAKGSSYRTLCAHLQEHA